ncbi:MULTISPECIES: PepSY-associated TM helix domain-containing protein [unclassified Tenacibaculum]|uniref:PepSY-associated TM helix domain-containing protein n=1 Tax=unclassified Tenacibaculum TaxID=2635139 RepID=UPI001F33755D|nr:MULTISPECIES: PepSY-associated TM helix domain-containing protein [unclassified Tenacibaculum]MCF2874647.1 PepSY domain-containing protein [Tenacibaculum sp. Cn5-1]MCF2934287.1 PepSY domain-containing protein [Tenacibaculum sp. Cn5-34]MCG7510497.1 PepSY domain-containing protein [Tenacibaculum sp. Cn5-46]
MSKRNYNVFFNTHTVSGIVISVALYVIFFAGAFALFKDEIEIWENGKHSKNIAREKIDYDFLLNKLSENRHLTSRDIRFYLGHKDDNIYVLTTPAKDTVNIPEEAKYQSYESINIHTGETATYTEKYGLGEFLYRLHFLTQIPVIGVYLAGFISLFFLFAIVTGVIVHWKKIVSNFYQFNPKNALKRVWTDAHTALGVIGLPFQFMYAVTGAYFCLSILVLIPANFLYNGDQDKLMEDLRPDRKVYEWVQKTNKQLPSVNDFVEKNTNRWDNFNPEYVLIKNYGGTNMKYVLLGALDPKERLLSSGNVIYDFETGKTTVNRNPNEAKYTDDIQLSMGRLHFGNFGGVTVKIIYFILALITCFVIITGVLIWIEARNKKSMTLRQRLYTAKVGHIYMAICLSLFPVIALFFLIVKILPEEYLTQKMSILNNWFFIVWLISILFFRFKRNNYFTNKVTLLTGAILGFLVPIASGIKSNNWIWNTYKNNQFDILTIDLLWIILSATALFIYFKIKPSVQEQSAFNKHKIDYKNIKTLKLEEKNKLQQTKPKIMENTTIQQGSLSLRTKIIILWIFLAIGWIVHHMYGLFNIYYNETLVMKDATGEAPLIHHIYRILFEGMCLLFALLSIEISKKWFKITSIVWASIAAIYNIYHFFEAIMHESSNVSEIFMLTLVAIASTLLVININKWIKS